MKKPIPQRRNHKTMSGKQLLDKVVSTQKPKLKPLAEAMVQTHAPKKEIKGA